MHLVAIMATTNATAKYLRIHTHIRTLQAHLIGQHLRHRVV